MKQVHHRYRRLKEDYEYTVPPPEQTVQQQYSKSGINQIRDWGHKYLRASEVYHTTQGEGAVIFILDTAQGTDHPDLIDNWVSEYSRDYTEMSSFDKHGHGTHCAGIACASNNAIGIVGIAPKAKLGLVKVLNDFGGGASSDIAAAIRWVADLELKEEHRDRRKIVSMSFGGPVPHRIVHEAIKYAVEKGVFFVGAFGNSYDGDGSSEQWPGAFYEVLGVGNIQKDGTPSQSSSAGAQIDLAAPGTGIYSTYRDGGYAKMSGTSMACPAVAGIVALILSYHKDIVKQDQLSLLIGRYATDVFDEGFDIRTGFGVPIATSYFDDEPDRPKPTPVDPTPVQPRPKPEPKPEPKTKINWGWIVAGVIAGAAIGTALYFIIG